MARKDKTIVVSEDVNEAIQAALKPVAITNAAIKEGLCNYGYEILTGAGKGDKIPNRKGSNLVHEDMNTAFSNLNVHLAVLDDAFKFIKTVKTLDDMAAHDVTELFRVTGIKVQGSDENEGYILIGEKYVDMGSISLESPKITATSGYKHFDELKESIESVIYEVEQYMEGKAAPKLEQGSLYFETQSGAEFDNPVE